MELVAIQGAMTATPGTAAAWARVLADTPRAYITSPAGAHRSEAMIVDMYLSSPARRKLIYGVPLGTGVAKPKSLGGKGSVHESGKCLDVNSFSAATMRKHGFVNTIPTEPWHWEYRGPEGGGAGGGGATTGPTRKKDSMTQLYVNTSTYNSAGGATKDTVYARAGGSPGTSANWIEYTRGAAFGKPETDPATLDFTAHGPHQPVSAAQFANLKASFLEPVQVGGVTLGDITVSTPSDPLVVAALAELLSAVKALNPPG